MPQHTPAILFTLTEHPLSVVPAHESLRYGMSACNADSYKHPVKSETQK